MKKWFATWFNTPYYHLLYKDRNQSEAEHFIKNLLQQLKPSKDAIFLDVACGKGRHSKFIHRNGFNIHGVDLSIESIKEASKDICDSLHFQQHDMRETYLENYFDYALNLFTSFGYFETDNDNQKAINAMAKNLKKGGKLIIDFMNTKKVILNLVEEEVKAVDNICFHIQRKVENGFILKDIRFKDAGKNHHYQEKVQALSMRDFSYYLQKAGMNVVDLWGDYELNDFNALHSNRLIIVAQK